MASKAQEAKKVAEESTTTTVITPPNTPKRYSRQQALIDTLKTEETDMEKIVADADALYVKNTGGKSNIEAQKADFDWFVKVMVGIGMQKAKSLAFTFGKKMESGFMSCGAIFRGSINRERLLNILTSRMITTAHQGILRLLQPLQNIKLKSMHIDHGGLQAGVSQLRLDGPDVVVGLQQMGRKGVPEGVGRYPFGDARLAHGDVERLLKQRFMDMRPPPLTCLLDECQFPLREEPLMQQLPGGLWVLPLNGIIQKYPRIDDQQKPLDPARRKLFEKEVEDFDSDAFPDEIPDVVAELQCNNFGHICPVVFVGEDITETTETRRRGRYIPFQTKMRVVRRDNYTCQNCGTHLKDDEVEFDHIIPHAKGGSCEEHNIRLTCFTCNRDKSDTVEI